MWDPWEPWYKQISLWILVAVVVIGFLGYQSAKQMDRKCAQFLALAHTAHDSLYAMTACEKMKSDAAIAAAISANAGATAASRR